VNTESDVHTQEVADACRLVHFESGDVVSREDELGDSMFIVIKGRVKIEASMVGGGARFVDYLDVGEHFGEIAMLTCGRRAVVARQVAS
jgi:NTE family protein